MKEYNEPSLVTEQYLYLTQLLIQVRGVHLGWLVGLRVVEVPVPL